MDPITVSVRSGRIFSFARRFCGSFVRVAGHQQWLCGRIYLMLRDVLPGRKSSFRAGFRPDSSRESLQIGPLASLRPAGELILELSRPESGRSAARKPDFRAGSTIA